MSERRLAVLTILIGLGMRLAVAVGTDVYIDTAYYWVWGQRLELSYFDHPPLVGWALRLLGVHGLTVLSSLAPIAISAWLVEPAWRWRAAALAAVTPAFVVASVAITPDSLLFPLATLALGCALRQRWLAAGLAFAVALLAKYPALLWAVPLALAAVRARAWRGLSLAVALAVAAAMPVVWWNFSHDWQSLRFQAGHGTVAAPGGLAIGLELVASQLGMIGPLLFPLSLWWILRVPSDGVPRLAAGLTLLVFLGLGFLSRGEPNWPAFAAAAAVPGVTQWLGAKQRLFWAAVATSALVCLCGSLFLLVASEQTADTHINRRLHGYAVLSQLADGDTAAVLAPHYSVASEAAYYSRLPAGTLSERFSQFDIWPPLNLPAGATVSWVSEGQPPPEGLITAFERVSTPRTVEGLFGPWVVHRFSVWQLTGYRGGPLPR